MKQVSQSLLFQGRDVAALVATLRPILEEYGFTINALIAETSAYTPTNVTTDRAFDADTVAVAELADVVGTLLQDLAAKGIIS